MSRSSGSAPAPPCSPPPSRPAPIRRSPRSHSPASGLLFARALIAASPQVSASPHRLHPMVIAELGPQPLAVHGHRRQIAEIPAPHLFQQFFPGEDGVGMGEKEHQQ